MMTTNLQATVRAGLLLAFMLVSSHGRAQLFKHVPFAQYDVLGERMVVLDVNRDGTKDLLVSAIFGFGHDAQWRTEIFFGMPAPVIMDKTSMLILPGNRELKSQGLYGRTRQGPGLVAGDFTGDGLTDVFAQIGKREVAMYPGCADCPFAIDTGRAWVLRDSSNISNRDYPEYGRFMAIGDLNGDGVEDLVIWGGDLFLSSDEPWLGRLYIYYGGRAEQPISADILAVWREKEGGQGEGWRRFGYNDIAIADVTGDGQKDLIVQSEQRDGDIVYVDVYFGGPGFQVDPSRPDQRRASATRGLGALCVFDVNNDRIADLLTVNDTTWEFFFGGPAGFSTVPDLTIRPTWSNYTPWYVPLEVGNNIGDINADGWDDYLLGVMTDISANRVLLYLGDESGITPWPSFQINPPSGLGGVAMGRAAVNMGDMTGDGRAEFAVESVNSSWNNPGFAIYPGTNMRPNAVAAVPAERSVSMSIHPQPAHAQVTITVQGAGPGQGVLVVTDMIGREIARLSARAGADGITRVIWDGRTMKGAPSAPGVYQLRLFGNGTVQHGRLLRY
jgi:hypothetical protein